MDYEIVSLERKTVAGLAARTRNADPQVSATIGGLWQRFFGEGVYSSIAGKVNDKALGLYTDYEGGQDGSYTAMVGCEVREAPEPGALAVCTVPAGRYARFIVHGDMVKTVADAWRAIWTMDLPRSFACDFEEYQDDSMDNAEIHIYIGLKGEES